MQVGEWYQTRNGERVRCVFKLKVKSAHPFVCCDKQGCVVTFTEEGLHYEEENESSQDIVEHLPDCTSFHWKPVNPPKGWEIVTEGACQEGDYYLMGNNGIELISIGLGEPVSEARFARGAAAVIRKQKPKYRPFANAEEFKPFRDKWWRKIEGDENRLYPPCYYNDGYHGGLSFDYCLKVRQFEDGSPFGVIDNEAINKARGEHEA